MARNEITTPLDLKNLKNHNENYEELYGMIGESDKRLSESMWEELKDHNTLKMLEPVNTKTDLPADAEDKSIITVLDEQKVYARVNGEWQPFSSIDLDPFTPFKKELADTIAEYEQKIKDITADVTETHDTAIDSMETTQADIEAQAKTTRLSLQKATTDFTAKFNDYLSQLETNKDASLDDIEQARQEALASLNNQNTDNWQKYKLTQDDGAYSLVALADGGLEALHQLEAGNYYTTTTPIDMASSTAGFTTVITRGGSIVKHIIFRPYNSNQMFIKRFYNEWFDWEPMAGTRVELYDGSAKANGDKVYLKAPYDRFAELKIKLNRTGGTDILSYDAESSADISINYTNVYNDGSEGKLYEMILSKTSTTELTVVSQTARTFSGATSTDSGIEILKVWGVK